MIRKPRKELASRIRRQIELQTPTETPDTSGGFTVTWATTYTIWAEILPISSRELMIYMETQEKASYRFRIRYLSGISAKMRIKYGTRYFNIHAMINPDERNEMIEIIAEEGVAQ